MGARVFLTSHFSEAIGCLSFLTSYFVEDCPKRKHKHDLNVLSLLVKRWLRPSVTFTDEATLFFFPGHDGSVLFFGI